MGSSGSDHKNGSVSATLLFCQIQGYWSVKSGGNFSHYFRTEYAHFLNQLETVYNVSKMAVDEIIKEVTSLSNSIHTFLMSKFATKLGKISHNRTQGRIQDSGGRGATAGQTPTPRPGAYPFLCTGARHYALYRFTLISNNFCFSQILWQGGGGQAGSNFSYWP